MSIKPILHAFKCLAPEMESPPSLGLALENGKIGKWEGGGDSRKCICSQALVGD